MRRGPNPRVTPGDSAGATGDGTGNATGGARGRVAGGAAQEAGSDGAGEAGAIATALAAAAQMLAAAGVPEPMRDARALMAAALGLGASGLAARAPDPLPAAAAAEFARHVEARLARRPVAQILGRRLFWGREFAVTGATLDPRPETETLVVAALAGGPARRVLDLGVGSGAILVTLLAEWPGAEGVGTDASAAALAVAAANAARHGVAARAALIEADWAEGVSGRFDLVASNPPYIPAADLEGLAPEVRDWEPRAALTPGPTGLEAHARIAAVLPRLLAPGGRAILEFGPGQGPAVAALLAAAGLGRIALLRDLDGRERAVSAVLAAPPG